MEYCGAGSVADIMGIMGHPIEEKLVAAICKYVT